jgi:hypothetical protein
VYHPNPVYKTGASASGFYSIRQKGIQKFDRRNAIELLNYMLDVIRDESFAFSSLGIDLIESEINNLGQILARLEQKIPSDVQSENPVSFLLLKPFSENETVFVEFWSTAGDLANQIPSGSDVSLYSDPGIRAENLKLVSTSRGGRDALKPAEQVFAFKEALISRGRVVTEEDIRAFCFSKLGSDIRKVLVQKGISVDQRPNMGLIRTIEILLKPADPKKPTAEEWEDICAELQVAVESRSAFTYPVKVKVN